MRVAHCKLRSMSPYSQSRMIQSEIGTNETHDAFEKRTWKERCHVDKNGEIFIPGICFKNSIAEAAKYLSRTIKGKGKATYTKHFEAGMLCLEDLPIGVHIDDVDSLTLAVPSNGQRGGSKRVKKTFPMINEWSGVVPFTLFDDIISEEEFQIHLEASGKFIGVGRYRPRNNGTYGRFAVDEITWTEE